MTKTTIIISIIFIAVFFASCSNPITPVVDFSEEDEVVVTKTTEKDTVEKVDEPPVVEDPKTEVTPPVEDPKTEETPAVEEPAGNNGNWWDDFDWEAAWNEIVEAVEDAIEEADENDNGKGKGRDNNNGNHYGWYK